MSLKKYLKPAMYASPIVAALGMATPSQAAECGSKDKFMQLFQTNSGETRAGQGLGDDGLLYQLFRKGEVKPKEGEKSLDMIFGGAWSVIVQHPAGAACHLFGNNYNWENHKKPITAYKEEGAKPISCPKGSLPRATALSNYRKSSGEYVIARGVHTGSLVELLVSPEKKEGKPIPDGKTWRITLTIPYKGGQCTATYKKGTNWETFKPTLVGERGV